MPKISVIVPVYRVEKYLPRCVESILAQTFSDFELWLVDDGSPDRCGALCDAYAVQDSRIRVIHQENGGLSAARNAALERAAGEWIAFVDSDDRIAPEHLQSMYDALLACGGEMAVCNFLSEDAQGNLTPAYTAAEHLRVLRGDEVFETLRQPSACNKLYRSDIFRSLRFPVGRLYEDLFVSHQVLAQVKTVVLTGQATYYYLKRTNSIMHSDYTLRNTDVIDALDLRVTALEQMGQEKWAAENRLFLYSQTAAAFAHLQRSNPAHAARLREVKAVYDRHYPALLRENRSARQRLRLRLLRYAPAIHSVLFGKKMPGNLS